MDLLTVTELARPTGDDELGRHLGRMDADTALLSGGTWLFSTPQPHLRRLVDLTACGWTPITERGEHGARDAHGEHLEVAATATLAELAAYADRTGHRLIRGCCEALVGSAKVWNMATVGGNVALALPAGPMTTLAAVLDGIAVVRPAAGGVRRLPVTELVTGPRRTVLRPGDVLRALEFRTATLRAPAALRKASLAPLGRSAALLAGRRDPDGTLVLAVTASLPRPAVLRFGRPPGHAELDDAVDTLGARYGWYDDPHGSPAWRRAMTRRLAAEIVEELA